MREVEPQVFLIGETRVVADGLRAYLRHIGVPDWQSDAPTDAEKLVEVYGRLCYRSFELGFNPNVTKIRKENRSYLRNIVEVKHGSVTEHSYVNFIFADVSRVFTHELVRHRAGIAISQESLRFVRLEDLGQWLPAVIKENDAAVEIFSTTFRHLEDLQIKLAQVFKLDDPGVSFAHKKVVTSALRRIAPIGLATTIGWTVNFRSLRWILETRTDAVSEEEIRLVFGKVGKIVVKRYPNMFGDFTAELVNGLPHYRPGKSKI